MERNLRWLFLAVLIAATTTFSCISEQAEVPGAGQKTVTLLMHSSSTRNMDGTTRSMDGALEDDTRTPLLDANVYMFSSVSGNILGVRKLSVAQIASVNDGSAVVLSGVPAQADRLLLVINAEASGLTLPTASTTGSLLSTTFGIATQMTTGMMHSAEKVVMTGMSGAYTLVLGDPLSYTVDISVSPLVSRLELGAIRCEPMGGADTEPLLGDVEGFTVAGIYVNRFSLTTSLGGTLSATVDNGDAAANYSPVNYATSMLYDLPSLASDMTGLAAPTGGKVWAWQLFPGEAPHLVIALDNILYADGEGGTTSTNPLTGASGVQYLTVLGFSLASDGTDVTSLTAGRVYHMDEIAFNAANLGDFPYQSRFIITGLVNLLDWNEAVITTEYD